MQQALFIYIYLYKVYISEFQMMGIAVDRMAFMCYNFVTVMLISVSNF